ncbi:hypothetical protein RHGRI_036952 [Rhododendron griersonianum]|uniref:1,3-beta-glucan synthase subunit FKS1-like domain-containing protein n=1 Tax=Rhododendron griersonianum TaxID=479676 RepID=A0AAV6HR15_9ERIC|nr:hypothetical protein RHGRI_036952 [Rhododendron griersonianum]KAG5516074.1 hypothetical protein RHGRI_036952 [Rhododendron griersonianum]
MENYDDFNEYFWSRACFDLGWPLKMDSSFLMKLEKKKKGYVLYWLVIFACKFTFAYFLQIKPLFDPTRIIVHLPSLTYSWHDLISKNLSDGHSHMAYSLICNCWWSDGCTGSVGLGINTCLFVVIFEFFYLILGSSYISFGMLITLYLLWLSSCSILGSISYYALLMCNPFQQIRSLEMVHKRFESFPEAFA